MSDPNAFQPFLVIVRDAPALWRLSPTADSAAESSAGTVSDTPTTAGSLALAVFSDAQRAEQYALAECGQRSFRVEAPRPVVVVRVLAACVEQGVEIAVLNPHGKQAGRVFDLKAILRRVREQLRAGEPLAF